MMERVLSYNLRLTLIANFKPVQSSCRRCMSPENMVLLKVKQASLSVERDNGPARMI